MKDIEKINIDKLISDFYYYESEVNLDYALEHMIKEIVEKQNEIIDKLKSKE